MSICEQGRLGTVHLCRIYNQKPPWGMDPEASPTAIRPPDSTGIIWNGPAPEHAYNAALHANWHHLWRYSGGDIANDASHQIDLARWLLGVTYPKTVYSTGGRFATAPEQLVAETPDTQIALYDFDGLLVSFELTLFGDYMLKTDPEVRDSDMFPLWMQNATRIEIFGTEGLMVVGRHGGGWQVFERPKSRQPVVKEQHVRSLSRSRTQGELSPLHPHATTAQRRRPGGPPQRPMDPLRQYQLPAGRPEAADRSRHGTDRRQRGRHGAVPPHLSQPLDRPPPGVAGWDRGNTVSLIRLI